MATELAFEKVDTPDETPPLSGGSFDPRYPDSTPDAPYGFKPNGDPYKRHHSGNGPSKTTRSGGSVGRTPASEAQARSAASVLATANKLIGMALLPILPETAVALAEANPTFEQLAFEALLSDPALCKKILGAGTQSAKAQLAMAYGAIAMSVGPAAYAEVKARRAEKGDDNVS